MVFRRRQAFGQLFDDFVEAGELDSDPRTWDERTLTRWRMTFASW